jgi:hypothetical protein
MQSIGAENLMSYPNFSLQIRSLLSASRNSFLSAARFTFDSGTKGRSGLRTKSSSLQALAVLAMTLSVAVAADSDVIELYEYTGKYLLASPPPDLRPILLEVPQGFRYGSTRGVSRTWEVQILTYYPGFGSP